MRGINESYGKKVKYELDEKDKELFKRMKKEAVSENERRFFKEMEYRQQYHLTTLDDLLPPENTETKIGFYRFNTDGYMLLVGRWENHVSEYGTLNDLMFDEWEQIEEINSPFHNMLEYLRSIDYNGIDYNADSDWE